jgi:hypothetical protein
MTPMRPAEGRRPADERDAERAALYRGMPHRQYAPPGVGFTVSAVFPTIRYDNGIVTE